MPPQEAPSNTRALLSHLEQLRDSLSDRVEQLSTAVERLRNQATELEAATGASLASFRPSASELLPPPLPLPRLRDPVVELTRSMDGLTVETRIVSADHRGLPPTNLARVAAAPKPMIVRGPESESSSSSEEEEAPEAPTDRPSPSPTPTLTPTRERAAPAARPEPERPERAWDWWVQPPTSRPPGLTTRGMLVRARQGPEEPQPARERERERERDRDRDAREAERLDRAIARYQRRHDESQREFHSAWDSERTRAVGGGRVPNEHSTARADALRRHVDNAHRLWHLMHQRARLAVPPATEPDAPLEMRHLLGTPSFRRGPLRPRRPLRAVPTWLERLERGEVDVRDRPDAREPDFTEYYRDFTYDGESDEDDWPARRAQMVERLARMRAIAAAPPLVLTSRAERDERRRNVDMDADALAAQAARISLQGPTSREEPLVRDDNMNIVRRAELLAHYTNARRDLHAQSRTSRVPPQPIRHQDANARGTESTRRQPDAAERGEVGVPEGEPLRTPAAVGRPRTRPEPPTEGVLGDDGDAARRALLSSLSSTLARLNAAARRPADLRSDDEDVLERVERARERVAELSRIQRDLEAVRAGMRRGSDATVVPSDWTPSAVPPPPGEGELSESDARAIAVTSSTPSETSSSEMSENEGDMPAILAGLSPTPSIGAVSAVPGALAPASSLAGASTTSTSGSTPGDDEDKESGTLRADTWPPAPNRARARPYVSLLDL